jgi:hypothetical protein
MGVQAVSGMAAIAALTAWFIGAVTEKKAPARRTAPVNAAEQNAESARTIRIPVHPVLRAVPTACPAKLAAPREDAALPPRSRVAPITGAATGVLTVAASTFRPRTSRLLPWIFVCPNAAPCLWWP